MDFFDLREPVSSWSHFSWLLLSIPGTLLLLRRSRGNRSRQITFVIYGFSLALCLGSSGLFHGARGSEDWLLRLDHLDHIAIYVLIAGSYTPVAFAMMRGRPKWLVLAMVWMFAALGAMWIAMRGLPPNHVSTAMYLVMGWGSLYCYSHISRIASHRELFPLVFGGVLYSVGAVFNVLHWPVLWPGVFQSHELFHVFVMGGSLAHFWFMLVAVVPFTWATRQAISRRRSGSVPSTPHIPVVPARAGGWRLGLLWVVAPRERRGAPESTRTPADW